MMTPPFPIVLSPMPAAIARSLAEWVAHNGIALPGVTGEAATAVAFARAWSDQTGRATRVHTELGVYELERLKILFS